MQIMYGVIGRNIRRARDDAGLTQEMLAERLGLSAAYVGKLERGERIPNLSRLMDIAVILHIPLEQLVQGCGEVNVGHVNSIDGFIATVREVVKGCSPDMLQLMIDDLILLARYDKRK